MPSWTLSWAFITEARGSCLSLRNFSLFFSLASSLLRIFSRSAARCASFFFSAFSCPAFFSSDCSGFSSGVPSASTAFSSAAGSSGAPSASSDSSALSSAAVRAILSGVRSFSLRNLAYAKAAALIWVSSRVGCEFSSFSVSVFKVFSSVSLTVIYAFSLSVCHLYASAARSLQQLHTIPSSV